MPGLLAFWLVMVVFSLICTWWMNGKGQELVDTQRELANRKGKIVNLSFWKWKWSFQITNTFWVRLAFMALGPSAVMGLSVSYAQFLPLQVVFAIYVLPAYIAMIVLGLIYPEWGRRALVGYGAGVLATIIYDVVRLGLAMFVGLPDPIPHIALLWLGQGLATGGKFWWVGYLWRFFGNGGGLGIAYAMLPKKWFTWKGGMLYGEFVGLGMLAVLFFFPISQLHLFILNLTTLLTGIAGHWGYGITLGVLFRWSKVKDKFPDHSVPPPRPVTWKNKSK